MIFGTSYIFKRGDLKTGQKLIRAFFVTIGCILLALIQIYLLVL
ncbi:hypothetical protein [[Clostridium] colinum]|nr:hypothetical protein [[Clostridium] colinum]